jgi:pimeloyl-ACP methyl ester carboxylesterase
MNSFNFRFTFIYIMTHLYYLLPAHSQTVNLTKGIYDGNVGNDRFILVTEREVVDLMKGNFVLNRGKSVEELHPFSIDFSDKSPFFYSGLYVGPMKTAFKDSVSWNGKLKLMNKRRLLFFHPKVAFDFAIRPKVDLRPSERYQKEVFDSVEVKSNIIYGKAKGYWTSSPYSDEAYIVTLGKGLIKTFKDNELLDLKLDLYFSRADSLKKKPLVMLIHGGAFYIGSKESACEQTLALALAKRGYLVASIDYRLGFKPSQADIQLGAYRAIQDAHAALRFLSHHSKGIGFDPDQVYVGGTSAGAVASLNVAFMSNDERPERIIENEKKGLLSGIEQSGNTFTETFTIKAVANMWGAVGDPEIIDPDQKIPVLSIHGTADDIVPFDTDFPFKKSLMINRLIMDKMYGSKPIHDRLNKLGIRNKLVALPGLGHEPELETYNALNNYMDTLILHTSNFFYEETAPRISLPASQLLVSTGSPLKSIFYEISNGKAVEIQAEGGVKANSNPTDATIIWFDKAANRKLKIISTNKFDAWSLKEFPVEVLQSEIRF